MKPKLLGRRPGNQDTQAIILANARALFASHGYEHTTMRLIADHSDVNVALLSHYFKSKQRLFLAAVLPSYQSPSLLNDALANASKAEFGERISLLIAHIMDSPEIRTTLIGLIRAATSETEAGTIMRGFITDMITKPIADFLDSDMAGLEANLLGSQIIGIFLTRYIICLEPITSASPEDIARLLAPTIQQYVKEC